MELEQKKLRVRECAHLNYLRKLNEDPNYRELLNKKSHERHQRIRELKGELKPRGRPREQPLKEKKANGRPRKYLIDTPIQLL